MTRSAVAAVVVALVLSACGFGRQGLDFVVDDRVVITAPEERTVVTQPVTIVWTVERFEVTGPSDSQAGDAGYFGVLVDRAPPPPGGTLADLVSDDALCAVLPDCPDELFLRERGINATSDTSITLDGLVDLTSGGAATRDVHEVTVVLLNGAGARIGESAFRVEFEVDRAYARGD